VAETSGFATDLPQSAYLAHTMRRAISAAQQRSHRYVTLEHLLLALLDDPDALLLLEAARTDVAALRGAVLETVNHSLATLYAPGTFDLRASYKVERVLQSASDDARRIGCVEVDAAFVAVALFHETDSPAGDLLKRHNLLFHAAMTWIYRNRGAPAPKPAPPSTAEPPDEPEFSQTEAAGEEQLAAEPDAEVLLDEVFEDDSEDWDEPSLADPAATKAGPRSGEHEPGERQGRMAAPSVSGPATMPGDRSGGASWPPFQPRPTAARPAPEPEPVEDLDLGAAVPARERSPGISWEIGPAPTRSSPELGGGPEQERRSSERRSPAVPIREDAKIEPRLSTRLDQAHGPGSADRGQAQPGLGREHEPTPRPLPPASASGQELGAAVPARDFHAPSRSIDAPGSRPAVPHASAAERAVKERGQSAAAAGGKDAGGSPGNGVVRGNRSAGFAERRPAPAGIGPPPMEPDLPSSRRLEEMRLRPARAPEAEQPARAPGRKPAPAPSKDSEKPARSARRRPEAAGTAYAGKLAENIPRKMRAHKPEHIEVRISKEETEAFVAGFEGNAEPLRHDLIVTQAMSVMLRAPDGGFIIENSGPETQWIFNRPGAADKETFGRWRWSVTPTETGQHRLQLVVAARSVDQNGLAGDTVLPDQVITVAVRANHGRNAAQAMKWLFLLVLGGMITEGALLFMRLFASE